MCREGVLGQDADLAKWLRKNCSTPVVLAANKAERRGASGSSGMCWFTQAVFIYYVSLVFTINASRANCRGVRT
jgi:predicted GTPase